MAWNYGNFRARERPGRLAVVSMEPSRRCGSGVRGAAAGTLLSMLEGQAARRRYGPRPPVVGKSQPEQKEAACPLT